VKIESQSGGPTQESWSLITIGNKGNQTIDIKFIYKSKRSYVFSSDSFEVILDPLFIHRNNPKKSIEPILVESLSGDYQLALQHLKESVISTVNPEEIRRGIFRYCYELAKGKTPVTEEHGVLLETVFVDALIAEEYMNFDDVLGKFLQKHSSNGLLFLDKLSITLQRSAKGRNIEKYLQPINKYRLNLQESVSSTASSSEKTIIPQSRNNVQSNI